MFVSEKNYKNFFIDIYIPLKPHFPLQPFQIIHLLLSNYSLITVKLFTYYCQIINLLLSNYSLITVKKKNQKNQKNQIFIIKKSYNCQNLHACARVSYIKFIISYYLFIYSYYLFEIIYYYLFIHIYYSSYYLFIYIIYLKYLFIYIILHIIYSYILFI
jgi:hypothetical protein